MQFLPGDPRRPGGLHLLPGQFHGRSQAQAPSGLSAGAQQVELGQRSGRLGMEKNLRYASTSKGAVFGKGLNEGTSGFGASLLSVQEPDL